MILLTVFLVSTASLFYEVLLTRFFSITQWYHLSFMVISIALFGFTASGILLNLLAKRSAGIGKTQFPDKTIRTCVSLFSVSVLMSFVLVNRIPLDYFKLSTEPVHFLYLGLSFFLLSLPFFFCGFISALAYSYRSAPAPV